MSEVEFDNSESQSKMLYSKWQASNEQPMMVRWLINKGIVKNAAQANMILLGIAIVAFALSLYFFFFAGPRPGKINPATIPAAIGPGPVNVTP